MLAEGSRTPRCAAGPQAASVAIFLTVGLLGPLGAGGARAADPLVEAKRCGACHAESRKVVGPSWDAIAERYRGRPEVAPALAAKIRSGGAGAWGAVPMPANTQVDDAEARRLVAWILARPAPARRP